MTWIPTCDKTGVCFHCNSFVDNPDWEGWDDPKRTSGGGGIGAAGCGLTLTLTAIVILALLLGGC